jgi:uncharacterized RmlC-like cupin family protein
MGKSSFVIAGNRAAIVANDVSDFHYRAAVHHLPPGARVMARCNEFAETQIMVEDGTIEAMVGGASVYVLTGDFVRIPPGVAYAYCNGGDTIATLLIRSASPETHRATVRLNVEFAA